MSNLEEQKKKIQHMLRQQTGQGTINYLIEQLAIARMRIERLSPVPDHSEALRTIEQGIDAEFYEEEEGYYG